jgi:hypothetical protein
MTALLLGDKRETDRGRLRRCTARADPPARDLRAACAIEETHGSLIHTPDLVKT